MHHQSTWLVGTLRARALLQSCALTEEPFTCVSHLSLSSKDAFKPAKGELSLRQVHCYST